MKRLLKSIFTFRVLALAALLAVVALAVYTALGGVREAGRSNAVAPASQREAAVKVQAQRQTDPQNIFFLGDQKQSGCLVCHGDPKLTKVVDGKPKSFYVDINDLKAGPHKDIACTACHKDFGPSSHVQKSSDWKEQASLACIRCHEHNPQYIDYSKGIHGQLALQSMLGKGGLKPPMCGDCHKGHKIKKLKGNPEGKAGLRADAQMICGDCHGDYWKSYDDYYHGRAFKTGASDAPSCWDCHGYHTVLPKRSADSMVSESNLPRTCDKCHSGSTPEFVDYAKMIHGTARVRDANIVYSNLQKVLSEISAIIGGRAEKAGEGTGESK